MFTKKQKKELIKRGVDPNKIDTMKKSDFMKNDKLMSDMFGESSIFIGCEPIKEKDRLHFEYTQFLEKLLDAICDMEDDKGMDELFPSDD